MRGVVAKRLRRVRYETRVSLWRQWRRMSLLGRLRCAVTREFI